MSDAKETLPIGIHRGVSSRDYFRLPYASNSTLKSFAQNPHRWKVGPPFKPTDSMRHGSLVDCMLLTPERLEEEFALCVYENFRTKEAQAWRDKMTASGLTVVTADERAAASEAVKRIKETPAALMAFENSIKQVVAIFDMADNKGRVTRCKAMIDLVSTEYAVLTDLKTAADASPEGFARAVVNFGYAHQAAFYLDGYNLVSGEATEREGFNFLVSENKEPWEVATYCLELEAIEYGRRQYMRNLTLWNDCNEADEWPGYTSGWQTLELPGWVYAQEQI